MKYPAILLAAGIAAAGLAPGSSFAQGTILASPDQRTRLEVKTMNGLGYALTRDGKPILAPSPMGLFTDHGPIGAGDLVVAASEKSSIDDSYSPLAGKASRVADRYNQLLLHLSRASDGARFDLVLRAYDNGIAFRFVVPAQKGFESLAVFWESTGFYFANDYKCWGMNAGGYDNAHEGEFDPVRASAIRNFNLYDAPLVCKIGVGETTFAIAEADKRDYAGAYLSGRGDGGLGVNVSLPPRPDNPAGIATFKTAVRANLADGPLVTPWRVVMLGDRPGDLIASNLIQLLATPTALADTSWIKPGKSAWDWWNGWAVNIPDAGINTATYKAYVDFAQKMKLDYILIDEGWYKGSSEMPRPADVTVPVPAMDIPGIVRYAADRKVGVWVWLHWKQLERQLDPALALYEAWGIKGIKVDFMNRNDQEMVEFYHSLLSKAAAHHLMVDLHGAYPPDGLARTYPNFLTQEGVMGAEYNKWSTRITATHNVTLPFTRMLLGPMDYTPGGFHALPPAEFAAQHRSVRPFVQTTRGQAIAMYVVYDSPLAMVADSPDSYVHEDGSFAEGAELLARMPTTWDETRVLMGDIGDYIVMARRKGSTWYIGAMTNELGRTLSVPLTFLGGDRSFVANIHEDGADPNRLKSSEKTVTARDRIALRLAGSGGAVVELTPRDP